jgi:hypothetical protein
MALAKALRKLTLIRQRYRPHGYVPSAVSRSDPSFHPQQQHETGLQFLIRLRRKHNIAAAARLSQKCNSQRTTPTFGVVEPPGKAFVTRCRGCLGADISEVAKAQKLMQLLERKSFNT